MTKIKARDHFAGMYWAIEPSALTRLMAQIDMIDASKIDTGPKAAGLFEGSQQDAEVSVQDGVATINILGPMMKLVPSFFEFFGIQAADTGKIKQQVAQAAASDKVSKIVLNIDSPGGTVDGTAELARAVADAAKSKEVHTVAADMMASAAFWVGSQADTIAAGPTAMVGSIGTVAVVDDFSKMFEKAGVKTHVVSNHELKGAFTPGAEVTEEQLADLQRNIDSLTEHFIAAVAEGRGLSESAVADLATGQVWIGAEAKALGLVDAVHDEKKSQDDDEEEEDSEDEDDEEEIDEADDDEVDPEDEEEERAQEGDDEEDEDDSGDDDSEDDEDEDEDNPKKKETKAPQGASTREARAMKTKANASKLEAARSRIAELEAQAKSNDAEKAVMRESARNQLIEANRDRLTPKMMEHIDGVHPDDNEKFAAFLATLQVQTRSTPVGRTGEQDSDSGSATAEDIAAAKLFGIPVSAVVGAQNVDSINFDGTFNMTDGSIAGKEVLQ